MPAEKIPVLTEAANRQVRALVTARARTDRKTLLAEVEEQLRDPRMWIAGPHPREELPKLDEVARYEGDGVAAVQLHRALANLSRVEASDSRLWNALSLTRYRDYVEGRWGDREVKLDTWTSRRLLPIDVNAMRPLARHTLTRLWWTAHILHDPYLIMPFSQETGDPYAYVELAFAHEDLRAGVMERSYWGLGGFPLLLFETVRRLEQDSKSLTRDQYRLFLRQAMVATGHTRVDYVIFTDPSRALSDLEAAARSVLG
jgi:hypothetical protein